MISSCYDTKRLRQDASYVYPTIHDYGIGGGTEQQLFVRALQQLALTVHVKHSDLT